MALGERIRKVLSLASAELEGRRIVLLTRKLAYLFLPD